MHKKTSKVIFENKMFLNIEVFKNVNKRKCAPNMNFSKNQIILDIIEDWESPVKCAKVCNESWVILLCTLKCIYPQHSPMA